MKRFVEFCRQRSLDGCLPPAEFHCFGDWLSINADTPREVIYTAYFAYSTQLVAQAAAILGKAEDAALYQQWLREIKNAFQKAYVDSDGRIHGNTQCVYVLALAYDLLTEKQAHQAAEHLVADIESRDFHLSTGFVGTKDLMLVLAKIGRNDLAYRLIQNETFPSWGFSIKHGATSIWERWDGWTPEKGFQDPGMNSFAHYSFGAVYQWMFENIGGITRIEPGYKKFLITPHAGGNLTWAKTDYFSIHGRIRSHWKQDKSGFHLVVEVPGNTTAQVQIPADSLEAVYEGGKPVEVAEGVSVIDYRLGKAILQIGSGKYNFLAKAVE
jgi:alpha-L-rhamnosidase